ncbi:P-loop containing nucleoside triphosphate hydrolase protein, partial [Syncephalis pseudoplumigaleata]
MADINTLGSTKVSFKDVIAATSTIRALQTLISLPLLYPDHFNHGVLTDHALTGILLFGPPGTGKTMLAKAVAAESGSSMLEIKGSDIYDKYVGESEKNVRAIFSVARKMAPCVIFIDEVDALFASRGSDIGSGSGKRETVNQFMAEWDGLRSGLRNRGVTVLCATNRPFDLDDAVLRRMPRRIL